MSENTNPRQLVYDAIDRERDYQDMVWGRGHDEAHDLPAWLLIMRYLLSEAETAWLNGGPGESQRKILQTVATGVAAIEVCGLFERNYTSGRKVYNMSKIAGVVTGYKWSSEQRSKISKSRTGRRFTKEQRQNISDGHAALNTPVDLVSPDGIVYYGVKNIREFCRTHQLISTALSRVVKGQLNQHKGWTRLDRPYAPKTFAFLSPDGLVYKDIERCDVFCKEHGLSRKNMSAVHTGKKKSHNGWTKYHT